MIEIHDLPDIALHCIFSFLSADDMFNVLKVSARFARIASSESIWIKFCKKHCFLKSKEKETWKDTYTFYHEKYGKYLSSESELLESWLKLKDIVKSKAPTLYESLEDGLSEEELDDLLSQSDVEFPLQLRYLYRLCAGQNSYGSTPGLFGSVCNIYSDHLDSYSFCPLEMTMRLVKKNVFDFKTFKLQPLASNHFCGRFCVVLPKEGFSDMCNIQELKAYSVVWFENKHIFHVANSVTSWIKEYTERILSGQYVINDGHILRYFYDPESISCTGPFIARAGWAAHRLLRNNNLQFEYRIILEMDKEADPKDSCQLLSRHWDITWESDGRKESVNGPGVVGEYPVMKPGKKFSWMSRVLFQPPGGSMSGYFLMRNLRTSKELRIECPVYRMSFPKEYKVCLSE